MRIFVIWSGNRSKKIAEAAVTLLEGTAEGAKIFVSSRDLKPGRRWEDELSKNLREANIGIVCFTPDNLNSRWMHFEAGMIAKMPQHRILPLLADVNEIKGPLSGFMSTDAKDKEAVFRLVKTLNEDRPARRRILESKLREFFECLWDNYRNIVS